MPDVPPKQKMFSALAPTLGSYQTGAGDMGLVRVQVLATAEQNSNGLTMQRGKRQLYCFPYVRCFVVAVLYEKQSESGIIERGLPLCLDLICTA